MDNHTIRWCLQSDLGFVADIESRAYEYPLEYEDFILCLKREDHVGLVVEKDNKIVGFMLYRIKKDHYEVISMAVDPSYGREGAGSQLITYLIHKIKRKIKMVVSDKNLKAHMFLKKNGFTAMNIHQNWFGPNHHGYEFSLSLVKPKKKKKESCELG
jgi:ribosomal protein S18 acetylase RimI-like enzyme